MKAPIYSAVLKRLGVPFIQYFLPFWRSTNGVLFSLRMRNYGKHLQIYLFPSLKTSRDIVTRLFHV